MSECEQHQKIKYGDIIYIEYTSKDHTRNILKANGFNMVGKNYIEVEQLNITGNNIILKDFINNLFIIFPKMKEDFIKNKMILEEKLSLVKDKITHSSFLDSSVELKDNMTKLITAYQEIKQDVYNEKDLFLKDIGQPILFKKEFILIHFDSQNFVTFNVKSSKLTLTENYSDECIFLFWPWSSLDNNDKYVFSNQNLYICKKEKNYWSNNHFLTVKKNTSKLNAVNINESIINNINNNNVTNNLNNNVTNIINDTSKFDIDKGTDLRKMQKSSFKSKQALFESRNKEEQSRLENNLINSNNAVRINNNLNNINNLFEPGTDNKFNKNYVLGFTESQSSSDPFKIKICSNYIDPSSGNLSFSSPVWLVCQSIDKYLTIRPNIVNDIFVSRRKEYNMGFNLDKETEDERKYEASINNKKRTESFKLKSKVSTRYLRNREKKLNRRQNNYVITFDSIDKNNSLNNIYGLFYVEQCETNNEIDDIGDDSLKKKMRMKIDLKLSSYVQYHKVLRFLHVTTRKYLGFKESNINNNNNNIKLVEEKEKENNNIELKQVVLTDFNNEKTTGSLILLDEPDENCDWMFMESYKILNRESYYKAKSSGIEFKFQNSNNDYKKPKDKNKKNSKKKNSNSDEKKEKEKEETIYKIKNKEILRIFHVKSQKFLCFDEINNKLKKNTKAIRSMTNKYSMADDNTEEKSITVQNLSLSKIPYDCDLIRLIPSNADQSWEIRLVLYFSDVLSNTIQLVLNEFDQMFKSNALYLRHPSKELGNNSNIDNNNINNYSQNINNMNRSALQGKDKDDRLKYLKDIIFILRRCFKNLRDYCLNNFTRKFDTSMSAGKPIYFRQQFLYDQRFLEKTFYFLEKAKDILPKFNEPIKIPQQKIGNDDINPNNMNINNNQNDMRKMKLSTRSAKKNVQIKDNNIILEIWKYFNDSIKFSFQFISAMCKDHPLNKRRVYKENSEKNLFIHFLLDYEDASKCLLDIIKDNEKVMNSLSKGNNNFIKNNRNNLDEDNNDNVIGKVLNYLNKCDKYDTKNLSTLSKFLKTGDVGITSNQQYIFEEIFINGKDRFLLKIKPLYDDIQFLVVFKNENDTYSQKSLIEFSNTQIQYEQKIIKYLAVQLNLFADLCYGRNYVCIEKIRELFPLDHLIYHISRIEINQEILEGLINILNFTYIDIEPHISTIYPSMIKVINSNLQVERVNKGKVRSYIPLDKLNLILCLSLFILNNIKYGKIIVNSANINMILNIIKLRLYENVIYTPMDISEVENEDLNRKLHNLKDEVKYNVIHGEELLMNKSNYNQKKSEEEKNEKNKDDNDEEEIEEEKDENNQEHNNINNNDNHEKRKKYIGNKNMNSFYFKFGYKYIEFNFENPTGEEYLLFVLDRINDFFLNSLIINNIDYNTENKNIVTQNFKNTSNNDILTQSNINYLIEKLKELKNIFSKDKDNKNNEYKSILKQIEKVINYILDIKKEDMSIYLLENFLRENKSILQSLFIQNGKPVKSLNQDILSKLKGDFFESDKINEVLLDDEYYYYQLFNHVKASYNIPKIFSVLNNKDGVQNILLGGNTNEKVKDNLLSNSLFSEDQTNQKNIIDFSDMENMNNDKSGANKDLIKFKDDDFFYFRINQPNNEINLDIFYMNAVVFKDLQELIIRILEMNINDKLTKVLIRMFTRLMSQRKEIFDCLKNVLLLYKKEDLDKYYQCNLSIIELSLLSEKTEKWMTKDRVLDNIKGYRDLDEINVNEIKPEQKDFFAVYLTLYKFIYMLKDKYTEDYLSIKEVKLIQTIFHSFQIESILSSLLREITQEFPDDSTEKILMKHDNNYYTNNNVNIISLHQNSLNNDVIKEESSKINNKDKDNEKDIRIRAKLLNYKNSLEKLIKEIFCLLEALVHKSSPNDNIIEIIEFTIDYKYFRDLGLNKLITELSYNEKYLKMKTPFLIDILKEQLKPDNFKIIKEKYFSLDKIIEYKDQRLYKNTLKKTILSLKLMKNLVTRISETNYLDILRSKFVEILDYFDIIKNPYVEGSKILNINNKKKNIIYLYVLQFSYYFLTIAYRLSKKSQRLKEHIGKLIEPDTIKKLYAEIPFPYTKEEIEDLNKSNLSKSTKLIPKLKFYYKLKGVAFELYYYLGHHELFQMKNISRSIIEAYDLLKADLLFLSSIELTKKSPDPKKESLFTNVKEILNKIELENDIDDDIIKDGYELIAASFRKSVYKYFLNSIFPVLYNLKNKFMTTSEFQEHKDKGKYFETEQNWRRYLFNTLFKEINKEYFSKVRKMMYQKENKIEKFFANFLLPEKRMISKSESNLNMYIKKYMRIQSLSNAKDKDKDKEEIFEYTSEMQEILFNLVMEFTSFLLNDIENNQIITDSINKESMVLAKNLKSKINFHSILKRSTKENEVNMEDLVETNQSQEKEMHLANVFLKFIQENYKKINYTEELNSLIELMGNIIEVPPEILPYDMCGMEYDFFYKDKINELKEIFSDHVQKLFLNNGSIEIFVKLACEGNQILDDNTFPIIIHFFNNLLDRGNTDVQKKFMQLFQTLPNSDNFFLHIRDFINKDIFKNLKDKVNIMEPKIDMENLNIIKDILRFLQLLAENHNTALQNFLREQTTNRLSYNFVNILVEYLSMLLGKLSNIYENNQEFTEYFINLYYERFLSCLDTIIEFLQGPCLKNQEYLISTKIIESFDKILGEIIISPEVYTVQVEQKNEFDSNKKETQTVDFETTFGVERHKSMGLTAIIDGEETTNIIRKDDDKKKDNPNQNKLFSKLSNYQKSLFIFKISLVFLSIIEGRKTKDDVIKKILRDFNYELIFKKSLEIYLKLEKECEFFLYIDENCDKFSESELQNKTVAEAGFNLYFLIQNLLSIEKDDTEFQKYASFMLPGNSLSKEQIDSYDNYLLLKKAMDFYNVNSVSIEILKDDIVFKVYCPKLSFFDGFDEKNKKNFDDNAKRTSLQTKLMSLMNEKDKIYHKIKQLDQLQKKFKNIWLLNVLFSYPNEVQNVGFALTILMNILIFFGYNTEKDADGSDVLYHVEFFGIAPETSDLILTILGIIIAFFSFVKLFEFLTREAVLIFKTLYTDYLKEGYEERINQMSNLEIHRIKDFFSTKNFKKIFIYIRLILDLKVIYALLYMAIAILGIAEHKFFFAFHLVEFILSQPILLYVFRAIIDPIAQLAYTFIFFFILIYFYSLIIFYFFQDIMPENSCDSPIICMVFIYSNTFTSGGNLGNFIDEGGEGEHKNVNGDMKRYALDISYTIIMVGLTWQMVSGLIVDTFESLRGSREDKEDDMKTICFICGLDKEKIEKYYPGKEGFEKHLKDHSVANYFFYTFYLEDKESSEYSGLESYIKDQIDNESISWFPNGRSLKIEEWESKHKITHDT